MDKGCSNEMCQGSADLAVKKVFAILGVDIDDPESVAEFQADLRFGKKLRKAADHGTLAFSSLIVVGLGAAVWSGITSLLTKGH